MSVEEVSHREQRVLVVDDSLAVTGFVVEALEDEGYQVDRATNGMEALVRCIAAPPDAILLDLLLPAMDGWQFMEALREQMAAPPPVIVMTANRGAWDHAAEARAAAYLAKPFSIDDLLDTLEGVLAKQGGGGTDEAARVPLGTDTAAP
jgi:DNA-binding response OmpR family regulator